MRINFKKIGVGFAAITWFCIFSCNTISAEKTVEPFIGKVMCTNPNDNEAWRAETTYTIDQEKVVLSTIIVGDKGKNPPTITEGKILYNSKEKVIWSSTRPGDKFAGQVYKHGISLKAGTLYTDFIFTRPKERENRMLKGTICKILN